MNEISYCLIDLKMSYAVHNQGQPQTYITCINASIDYFYKDMVWFNGYSQWRPHDAGCITKFVTQGVHNSRKRELEI